MKTMLAFAAGVATGWAVRSTVDGLEPLAVGVVAGALDLIDRVRRLSAIERERMTDLVAEARAEIQVRRAAERARTTPSTAPRSRDVHEGATG